MGEDERWAALIRAECVTGDLESDHVSADDLLCELLTELGYTDTVKAWEEVDKWYA